MGLNRSKLSEVVKVLDKEHGSQVLDYWRSRGEEVDMYRGDQNEKDGHQCIYYGLIEGMFGNWNEDMVISANATVLDIS